MKAVKEKNVQVQPEIEALSANDLVLKKYLELDTEIKALTKEFEAMKETLKHQGSFSTKNFVVIVEERPRTNPPSLEKLIKAYGEGVRSLCTVSTPKYVMVSKKA